MDILFKFSSHLSVTKKSVDWKTSKDWHAWKPIAWYLPSSSPSSTRFLDFLVNPFLANWIISNIKGDYSKLPWVGLVLTTLALPYFRKNLDIEISPGPLRFVAHFKKQKNSHFSQYPHLQCGSLPRWGARYLFSGQYYTWNPRFYITYISSSNFSGHFDRAREGGLAFHIIRTVKTD